MATICKRFLATSLLICFSLLCSTLLSHRAEAEPGAEKRAAIEALLVETDALKLGAEIGKQLINGIKPVFKKAVPNITDEALDVVVEETLFSVEKAQSGLIDQYVLIYDRYFEADEIDDLRVFYRTPTGKKSLKVMPLLMQDAVQIGQTLSKDVMQDAMPRIVERLEAMGYKVKQK
ncbi:DUF2059 domain-containing protein [Nisaea acidiphila]|uniref:DUF2059 domain-containing protein n=1 Tax=Nisaea acidiphila TaxID=1862145 RepID=A0A9J7AVS8_9PROT|nr:DUF2059 domain-containing protein [Nisaea acidiphila]UUX51883.1 DUF2059 domain-containing protein [Nisaea acidiphila]